MNLYKDISNLSRFYILVCIVFCNFPVSISAQICTGSLGENIFESGDFGSGAANVVTVNPMIADDYEYVTITPHDGAYTVCKSTGYLSGLYPSWMVIGDNSSDNNGYMMVINASYNPGIFYEYIVEGLCENTLYEFSADIINLIKKGWDDHIDPNVDFLIDDVVRYSSGDIPKTERWENYGFYFVTTSEQTSIKLTLRNNAPGGIGNDLALDNISFRPCGPTSFIGINTDTTFFLCIDDDPITLTADITSSAGEEYSLFWQESNDGFIWNDVDNTTDSLIHDDFEPGEYYYRYVSAANPVNLQNEKCRVFSDEIKITVLPDEYFHRDTICEGLSYEFGNLVLDESGEYVQNFNSRFGCDSTVYLDFRTVKNEGIEAVVSSENPSCFNFSNGRIQVEGIEGMYPPFVNRIFDEEGNLISDYNTLRAGIYTLELEDRFGCVSQSWINIDNPDQIWLDIGKDTSIRFGGEITFEPEYAGNFDRLNWNGNGEFACSSCLITDFLPYSSQDVILQGVDINGCIANDTLNVLIKGSPEVYLPNVFSPNGDRTNDDFIIQYYGRSVLSIEAFNVYDRWGGIIHSLSSSTPSAGMMLWDGYSKNTKVGTGVYTYVLKIRYITGEVQSYLGTITILE